MSWRDRWLVWDLDGCLVDNRHRVHLLKQDPPDWASYVQKAGLDAPYYDTQALLFALHASGHFQHAVITGRIEHEGENTKDWLRAHGMDLFAEYHFRKEGDLRPAPEIKLEIVQQHFSVPYRELVAVFEDHPKTTEVLRGAGIQCLHVREYR